MKPWKRFEHSVCRKLRELGFAARRTTSGRQGQEETADIEVDGFGKRLLVECKSTTDPRFAESRPIKLAWLRKLEAAAEAQSRIPVLVYNYPRRGYYATIRVEDLAKLSLLQGVFRS